MAKISFRQQKFEDVLGYIEHLISLLPQLNGNYAEESINKLLTRYSSSSNMEFVNRMYDVIVSHLDNSGVSGMSGQRLWLKININRLNNFLDAGNWPECKLLIKALNSKLEEVLEMTRNSYGLEVIAAEISYVMKQGGDLATLCQLYRRSTELNTAITHPRVMGIVRECGATIHYYSKNYDKARIEFYECFKNYDEAGSEAKKKILKYLSLCSLLTENEVNPFESQETQTYSLLPEYQNLIALVNSYERQDLTGYLAVVKRMYDTHDKLSSDKIFQHSEKQILHNLKVKLLNNYLSAYSVIKYDTLLRKLLLAGDSELEDLIISMANSGAGANVRLNFCDRLVEVVNEPPHSMLPVSLDAHVVQTNRELLEMIGFRGFFSGSKLGGDEAMQLDGSPLALNAYSTDAELATLHSDVPSMPKKVKKSAPQSSVEAEEEWLSYMRSAFPSKTRNAVSQKEQIFTEQLQDSKQAAKSRDDDPENDVAEISTTGGILGSSLEYRNAEDDEEEEKTDKLRLLETWSLQLFNEINYPVEKTKAA